MPLYEMILVCKLGESQAVANLLKSLTFCVHQEGGIIRRLVNLGDRIPAKGHMAKDKSTFQIVRYFAVEFDANPDSKLVAEQVARQDSEVMQVFTHKLKDKDYYKRMLDSESWRDLEQDYTLQKSKENLDEAFTNKNVYSTNVNKDQTNQQENVEKKNFIDKNEVNKRI